MQFSKPGVSPGSQVLAPVALKPLSTTLASTSDFDAVVVMVVLSDSPIAELPVLARLAVRTAQARRSVWDDVTAILTARQITLGGCEPVELEVHRSEKIAHSPAGGQPLYRQ